MGSYAGARLEGGAHLGGHLAAGGGGGSFVFVVTAEVWEHGADSILVEMPDRWGSLFWLVEILGGLLRGLPTFGFISTRFVFSRGLSFLPDNRADEIGAAVGTPLVTSRAARRPLVVARIRFSWIRFLLV